MCKLFVQAERLPLAASPPRFAVTIAYSSPSEAPAKEEDRIQKIINKRRNESDKDRQKRAEREEKDHEEGRQFEHEIADAYNFCTLSVPLLPIGAAPAHFSNSCIGIFTNLWQQRSGINFYEKLLF